MEKKLQHIVYNFWADENGTIFHGANLADLTWAIKSLARDNRKLEAWIDRAMNNPDNEVMPDLLPKPEDRYTISEEEFENILKETK